MMKLGPRATEKPAPPAYGAAALGSLRAVTCRRSQGWRIHHRWMKGGCCCRGAPLPPPSLGRAGGRPATHKQRGRWAGAVEGCGAEALHCSQEGLQQRRWWREPVRFVPARRRVPARRLHVLPARARSA